MTVDRRRFLQLSALGVVASFAESACSSPADRDAAAVDRPALLAMLGPNRVRDIGLRYRAATPVENTADALRSAISSGHRLRVPFVGASLNDQIRDDFADGRTVIVDGWVLSVTEARQCALNSLARV
jgi:hypothetical protein